MFGVEILNDFFLAIVLLEPEWKQHIRTMYKPHQGVMHQCLFVLPKISTFWLFHEGFCLKFPGHLHYSDGKVFNGAKMGAILPGVYNPHFEK